MARIRSIHPDALKSEKLSACSPEAERCYYRLLTHCDDEGRSEDDITLLASYCFPLREDITGSVIDEWLQELHDRGLLIRYTVENKRYLQVTKWKTYQKPQHPKPSVIPSLSDQESEISHSVGKMVTERIHEGDGKRSLGDGEENGSNREREMDGPPLWTACATLLKEQISESVWRSSFADLVVTHEYYGLLIKAPSQWVKDRIESNYLPLIHSSLKDAGHTDLTITIELTELAKVHRIDKRGTA